MVCVHKYVWLQRGSGFMWSMRIVGVKCTCGACGMCVHMYVVCVYMCIFYVCTYVAAAWKWLSVEYAHSRCEVYVWCVWRVWYGCTYVRGMIHVHVLCVHICMWYVCIYGCGVCAHMYVVRVYICLRYMCTYG